MMDGNAAEQGLDPLSLPFDRFLSWVYSWFVQRLDDKGRRAFDLALSLPMDGDPDNADGEWSDEALAAQFMTATADLTRGISR